MAKWHKGSIREKKIDINLRLRQISEDIDEIIEYINKEENNVENIGSSEIKILIEGVRAVMDLVIEIKNK
tara:strand:+ start:127 stop:336 length:210 start_codon:yes stop_codon:yes gene_type:complete